MNNKITNIIKGGKIASLFVNYGFYIVFVIIFIVFSITAKRFLTIHNIANLLLHSAPLLVLTTGVTFVLISGDFDLSIGSVAYLAASVGCLLIVEKLVSIPLGILIIFLIGISLGIVNGLVVTQLKVPAFIATLGMLIGGRGLGLMLTGTRAHLFLPQAMWGFGKIRVGPLYIEFIVALAIAIICQIILAKTPFGRKIYAMGDNQKAAQRIGIKLDSMKLTVFVISGFLASVAGYLHVTQAIAVHSQSAYGWEFTAIAMAVIGGVSLFGGKGNIIPGVIVAVLLIMMIDNGLVFLGASPYIYPLVEGLIIFTAIFADSFKHYGKRSL